MARILSTKKLTEAQLHLLLNTSHSLVHYDAIQITALPENFPTKLIKNAIVTSQNTAKLIIQNEIQIDKVFCVGEKTAGLLFEHNYKVALVCEYASILAEIITSNYADDNFSLICSQQRLETIPNKFSQEKLELQEFHIYQTTSRYQKFDKDFDVVLFYSPSGIRSFFEANPQMTSIHAVCIGTTTAKAAQNYVDKVSFSSQTSVESVIVKAVKILQ